MDYNRRILIESTDGIKLGWLYTNTQDRSIAQTFCGYRKRQHPILKKWNYDIRRGLPLSRYLVKVIDQPTILHNNGETIILRDYFLNKGIMIRVYCNPDESPFPVPYDLLKIKIPYHQEREGRLH